MSNQATNPNDKKYDLIERTAIFGEEIIDFVRSVRANDVNRVLINQIVRSGTSIGANYMEADCAESKKDFMHKIGICKKEAKETLHWLRMIAKASPENISSCRKLWRESHELVLIFGAIIKKK